MDDPRLEVRELDDGRLRHLRLAAPPGNILDLALVAALRRALRAAFRAPVRPHALLLSAAGAHFGWGASIEDHRAAKIGPFLVEFHALARELLAAGLPMAVAIRGKCLGGSLELALLGQRLVAARDAEFATPEIKLGVFAPLASLLLPARLGQARAEELLLTGKSLDAAQAHAVGLVDELAPALPEAENGDPDATALAWVRREWLPQSASALRYATLAARFELADRVEALLPRIERLYRGELMATPDAIEGVEAFLAKRPPRFTR